MEFEFNKDKLVRGLFLSSIMIIFLFFMYYTLEKQFDKEYGNIKELYGDCVEKYNTNCVADFQAPYKFPLMNNGTR